ncbi:aminotransferase [Agromyces mediolanus]|uniref:aminotransferase n=1 Tax=Agromyces mediolanus TaxID=41986 RepID=UPI0038340263
MPSLSLPSELELVQPTPPELGPADAERIARDAFGLTAAARALGSHQDRNFLLDRGDGAPLLLKIANPGTTSAELEAQSAAAARIAERAPGLRTPRSLPVAAGGADAADAAGDADAATVREIEEDGQRLGARVLEFLDGGTLSGGGHLSPAVVRGIGELAARVDLALADFDAPGVERPHQWDLRRAPAVLDALLPYIGDAELRERLAGAAREAWAVVERLAPELPVQAVHGDLTDDNVVWSDPRTRLPDGIIDLGDLNRGWTVGELAITLSSLLHHDGVDRRAALRAATAYHALRPLSRAEAEALWALVVLRAAVLVASGHHVVATDPGNAYAAENLGHELAILDAATAVPLAVQTALVLAATGHEPDTLGLPAHVALLAGIRPEEIAGIELGTTSSALHGGRWLEPDAESAAARAALAAGASAALTRFGEARLTRSAPFAQEAPANVALGVELALARPVELLAPWPGVVTAGDDGLELRGDGLVLRLDGAEAATTAEASDAATGAPAAGHVARGAVIGRAATQLAVRVHRDGGPGAPWFAPVADAAGWLALVADPTPLLTGAAATERGAAGSESARELIARREAVFAEVQEYYFEEPPAIVRGWRELLVDADGRVYLDALNNVTSIGHAHPRLVEAVTEQWQLLNTNSRFNYPAVVEYAERLASLVPEPLDTVFLVNSGSEAVDLALRLARAATGRRDILAVREAYHGWTDLSDAVSTSVADNPGALASRPEWVHTVDAPNPFRGPYRGAEASRYAGEAVAEVERLAAAGTPVGAFIAETYYGNAGGIALPDGYLAAMYDAVRRHGGVAVADEVQVGYGRLGEWFWGFEQQGVVPDVVAVAKAIGNGHPLGAVITTKEIAAAYRSQGYFFSSAGGSPVSSVVGSTVLDVIREEGLQENARDTGGYFRERLAELGERHPLVGAVHGSGFYLGLEFVRDRETLEPATEETAAICERLLGLGVIVQPTGDHQNVLKIKPPMCLGREGVDAFVAAVDRVLTTGW